MSPKELRDDCANAVSNGLQSIKLVVTGPYPRGLFRGELLCENDAKERVYLCKVKNVLAWLDKQEDALKARRDSDLAEKE